MKVVGFTGSQLGRATDKQHQRVRELLEREFEPGAQFRYGMCYGWDDEAAELAREIGYQLIGHPPRNRNKLGHVKPDIELPAEDFIVRDDRIIDESMLMLGAPFAYHEQLRSGTWATIRHTAKKNKPGWIVWPNGIETPIEKAELLSRHAP